MRLAVFASGNGSTLQNLIDRAADGRLTAEIVLVLSDNPAAYALERARDARIDAQHVPWSKSEPATFSVQAFERCRQAKADLVVLAGFLKLVAIPTDFQGRVINVHPALIPAFSGKGHYGSKVHQAVLDAGVKVTGCTVHFCDNEYDHGPIILQRSVDVADDDDADSLAHRVQDAEREALPTAINLIAAGRVTLHGHQVRIQS